MFITLRAPHERIQIGGSGIGKTDDKLKPYVDGAVSVDSKLVHSDMEVKNFAELLYAHE